MADPSIFPTEQDMLVFLLEEVPRAIRRRFDERTERIGLSRTQWRILAYLFREEGMMQAELARSLELESMTVSLTLDKMQERGLIERRREPGDRRSWRIHATPEARALMPEMREEADATYAEMLAGLAPDQLAQFKNTLTQIAGNLRG